MYVAQYERGIDLEHKGSAATCPSSTRSPPRSTALAGWPPPWLARRNVPPFNLLLLMLLLPQMPPFTKIPGNLGPPTNTKICFKNAKKNSNKYFNALNVGIV